MPARKTEKYQTKKLSEKQLGKIDSRISANADKWLKDNFPQAKPNSPRTAKSTRGRKPKIIHNPFFGFIGWMTFWGRYPVFALDIVEGIARLDWHDRPPTSGGKSMPLSVRNLLVILESLPLVTTMSVGDLLRLEDGHSRRYVRAIELIIFWLMKCRPKSLYNEMEGLQPDQTYSKWADEDELAPPPPEVLEKLHYDLRTLTKYASAEEYEASDQPAVTVPSVVAFPTRQPHPKKHQVLQMLRDGVALKAISRETGVAVKTIRKWRDERLAHQDELQAA
jgi:hypothetical protein